MSHEVASQFILYWVKIETWASTAKQCMMKPFSRHISGKYWWILIKFGPSSASSSSTGPSDKPSIWIIQRAERAAVTGCGRVRISGVCSLSPPRGLGSEGWQASEKVKVDGLHVLGKVRGGMIQDSWLMTHPVYDKRGILSQNLVRCKLEIV